MNLDVIIQNLLLCAIVIDTTLGWIVLFKNPKHASNQSYFFLVLCITVWQAATFVSMFFFQSDDDRVFSFRLIYAAVIAVLICTLYFVNIFGKERHHRYTLIFGFATIVIEFLLVISTPFVFVKSQDVMIATGGLYVYLVFFVCALIAGIFTSIIQRLIIVDSIRQRIQLEYMIIGLFVPMLFGVFSTVLVPFLESADMVIRMSRIQVFGATTTVFFSFVMAYAMARHRLMDVRIVFQRKSVALMLTLFSIFLTTAIMLFVGRDIIRLNTWTVLISIIMFGVVTVLMYEVLLKIVSLFLKRGVVDLAVYTSEEKVFMRNIESPRTWARRWAGKLQKEFGVDSLECITYDHRAQCWRQVFPESKKRYALEEGWIVALQEPYACVFKLSDTSRQRRPVVHKMGEMRRLVCIAMYDTFRCMGVWMLGEKLDGSKWGAKDLAFLRKLGAEAEQELWCVMQKEYTLIQAMESGVEIPKELLIDSSNN